MSKFLQATQVEAHINRLTNISTQLKGYDKDDGRAAEAIPALDAVVSILQQEPFEPNNGVGSEAEGVDETGEVVNEEPAAVE